MPFDGATDVAQSGEQDAVSVSAGSVVTVDIDQVAADAEDLSVTIVLQKTITGGATVDLTDQIDGVTSSFALPETPPIGTVSVFLNGVRQSELAGHFSIVGVTLTLDIVPVVGDILEVQFYLADIGYGNADTLDGMHADEFAPADQSGSAVLSSNYYLTSDDTWEDTGLSMVLPGAGKYELHADVRGAIRAAFSTSSAYMVAKFYDSTAGVEIADLERLIVLTGASDVQFQMTLPMYKQVTVDGSTTISLYVLRASAAPDVVWSRSLIGSNYAGRTEISFKKIA